MKDALARKSPPAEPPPTQPTIATQEVGHVMAVGGDGVLTVAAGSGQVRAQQAASCLLEPQLGDTVLVAQHAGGAHVLAVLTQRNPEHSRLSAAGELELSAKSGHVTVTAPEGVRLVTPGEAAIAADGVRVMAQHGSLAVGVMSYAGQQLEAHVERVKTVANSVESVAQRWVQRLERAYRFIAESEQVRTRYYELSAKSAINLKSKAAIVRGTDLAKVDGGQIHLG